MARRSAAAPSGARPPEPLFTVLVGYETFAGRICELADGTVVAPGALVRWLPEAWVERVVFDSPDRVRNVGARRRIFSGATRRAVEVRDRECFSEFCDLPAEAWPALHTGLAEHVALGERLRHNADIEGVDNWRISRLVIDLSAVVDACV